jgi:hypothetical protein
VDLEPGTYGAATCSAASVDLLKDYFQLAKKPDIILFPTFWSNTGDTGFGLVGMAKTVAKNSMAYVVVANNTRSYGPGGGIMSPSQEWISYDKSGKPKLLYADLPLK